MLSFVRTTTCQSLETWMICPYVLRLDSHLVALGGRRRGPEMACPRMASLSSGV